MNTMKKLFFVLLILATSLIFAGCGDKGDKGDKGSTGTTGNPGINGHAVVSTTTPIANTNTAICPTGNGGTAVIIALDINDNRVWDAGDTTLSTANICTGTTGTTGGTGAAGHSIISAITDVPVGETAVCAAGTGGSIVTFYLDIDDSGTVTAGDTTLQTVTLCNGANGTPGPAPAPFTITGVVTDNAGTPLVGATVTLVGSGATATTTAGGAFGLEVLASGTYTLSVGLSGFTFTPSEKTVTVSSTAPNGTAAFASNEVAPIDIKSAGNFVILTETGITSDPTSTIIGNIGTSPITGTAITGILCSNVTGTIYTASGTAFSPCGEVNPTLLDTAVGDMQAAYTAAANRAPGTGSNLNLGGGTLATQTLAPGTYTWDTPGAVTITGDITLDGSATDIWIFQISGTFTMDTAAKIILTGGAVPENVFWQVADVVAIGTDAHIEGIILGQTNITFLSGATVKGRLFAQTAVTMISNTVAQP